MSTLKETAPSKADLTKAIESKVGRMDMAGLLALAVTLKVPVLASAKGIRGRNRTPPVRTTPRPDKVLVGSGIGPVVSAREGGRILDAIAVDDNAADWIESDVFGAGELASRLQISRGTLDNWRKAKKIIAFRKGLRNFVYPLRQFDRRKPLEGLEVIAALFTSPEETWEWLVAPNRMTGGRPPIDQLRAGDVVLVARAAQSAFAYA